MRKVINHLRNQPEEVRRHAIHLTVIVAGVVLVGFWLASLGGTFEDAPPVQAELSDELKPFAALRDSFVDGYKSISATAVDGVE